MPNRLKIRITLFLLIFSFPLLVDNSSQNLHHKTHRALYYGDGFFAVQDCYARHNSWQKLYITQQTYISTLVLRNVISIRA